jgi:signal transduction histidine kinase
MKNSVFLLCLFIVSHLSFSQKMEQKKIDSLIVVLTLTKEDTTKVKLLNKISEYLQYTDSKKALKYGENALKLAQTIHYQKGIGDSYNNLGLIYWTKTDNVRSLLSLYKAIDIYEKLDYKLGLSLAYNNLALNYIDQKKYNKGIESYLKALEINIELKNKKIIPFILNNIADAYLQKKEYQKALKYCYQALEKNKINDNQKGMSYNLTNIGDAYVGLKKYSKGIEAINESIQINNNDSNLLNGYNQLVLARANYLMALDETNTVTKNKLINHSIKNLNIALAIFKNYESSIDVQHCYEYLFKVNKTVKNYAKALDYFEKYTELKNINFSEESKTKIANLESQRELDLRDKKIEIQNLKIKSDARKVYLLYTITTAILLLLGLFLWLYLSKRKANLQLEDKNKIISNINKQKDKFFSIIAHDLRGPFNGFLGLTELLAEDIDDMEKEEIQFAAVNMRSSATNLNRLLENLLEWSRMEQGLIPFDSKPCLLLPVASECVSTLLDAANNKAITIQTQIDEKTTVFADSNLLQAVIRNLLSNAVKFTPKGGTILIQGKEDDKNTTIAIKDSGIGMNAKMIENLFQLDVKTNRKGTNDEPSTGLGLILCKEFVEKHGGKIWVESEENIGSAFYFTFPHAIT